MYVVVRTNDIGIDSLVNTHIFTGEYAACRVLDEVHGRYEHLEATGICALDRLSDTELCVRWSDGRMYRYCVCTIDEHRLTAASVA